MDEAGDGATSGSLADQPDATAVRSYLDRLLANPAFAASDRSRSFLRFVVEETLAGRGARLKAFTIAVEVFARDDSFDAQGDPLVRLEAGRLRRALEHYYLTEGRHDPIGITIPKGGYQPHFEPRPTVPAPGSADAERAVPVAPPPRLRVLRGLSATLLLLVVALGGWWWMQAQARRQAAIFRPSVLVVPFERRGGDGDVRDLALGVTDQVVAELTRFREITVYGRAWPATAAGDPMDVARGLSASHLLYGHVTVAGKRVRVHVQLSSVADGATVWAGNYDRDLSAGDLFAVQDEIATKVVTQIAQPYGELARLPANQSRHPDDLEAYRCGLEFYTYRRAFSRDAHARVLACLETTVARHPDYATGWAMLAMVRVDPDRFGFPNLSAEGSPLALAAAAARHAIALDPNDVRAWEALMLASYLSSNVAEGKAAGERALALNPNDLELVGEFGMRLAMAGDWGRGTTMIRSVVDRDPAGSRFHLSILAVDALWQGRNEEALTLLDRAQPVNVPTTDMLRAAVLGQLGRIDEAHAAGERGMRALPGVFDRLDAEFDKRNFQPAVRRALLEGWRRAGLPVPDGVAAGGKSGAASG